MYDRARDPQLAPDYYENEIKRLLTIDGEEMTLVINQDGEEFLVYPDENDRY